MCRSCQMLTLGEQAELGTQYCGFMNYIQHHYLLARKIQLGYASTREKIVQLGDSSTRSSALTIGKNSALSSSGESYEECGSPLLITSSPHAIVETKTYHRIVLEALAFVDCQQWHLCNALENVKAGVP